MIIWMKILFVTDIYPIGDENIAKALFYFVLEWKKQGHEVEVIRANFNINTLIRGRKIIQEKIYSEHGIKIYNLNFQTPFLFNVYNKLPKDFSLKNYDVLISHMPCGALLSNKLLKRENIKYICAVHASDIIVLKDFEYSIYFRRQLKKAYKNADKIAARSPVLQEKIETILPFTYDKTFVAYSGVQEEFISNFKFKSNFSENKNSSEYLKCTQTEDTTGNDTCLGFKRGFQAENITRMNNKTYNEKYNIITVSSLIKRKNIDVIIKGLSLINEDFHLIIAGDGRERKNFEKLVKKLKLEKKITFMGRISRDEVFENLKKSDIFILLSDNETFGLSYLEAMAAGNIIIAKENDGIDGILQNNKNAFLIKAEPNELKKCLEKIFSMKNTELEAIKTNAANTIKNLTSSKAAYNYLKNIQ